MNSGMTWQRVWWLILFILLAASTQAAAEAGQLDPSFGHGGIVTTDFGVQNNSNVASAVAVTIQPDGKILVCGAIPSSTGFPVAGVARYNTDGSLDKGFGNAGIVTTPTLGALNAITLQTDGKIVVAGPPDGAIVLVARYDSKGNLDTTFGTEGIFESKNFLPSSGPRGRVVVQPDGKILVAEGVLLRLLSDGQLDSSFGTEGLAATAGYVPSGLALLSSGKILVPSALLSTPILDSGFVTRYSSDGSLDTSFGINGQLATAGSGNAMVLLSTGEIVVGGMLTSSLSGPATGFAVSRYLGTGFPDAKFGTHGGVVTSLAGFPTLVTSGLETQSSGDIVTLGTASASSTNEVFALARYTPTGQLDTTFGTDGTVTTSFGTTTVTANGLAIQSDQKIVAVGNYTTTEGGSFDTGFKLARYLGQ
jgi:uncharacterized delta-60 repeat protein